MSTNMLAPNQDFDVIIVGGSYAGLAAGMALGRALRKTLIVDSGRPCNAQTPRSHNLLTHDGETPGEIAHLAKQQVALYETIEFLDGLAIGGMRGPSGFVIDTESGQRFSARKLIFATGIRDVMPDIPGFAECWGISVLHCPYCHGYEVRSQTTGLLGNGQYGYEFASLLSNWTTDLTLFTNGPSSLNAEQSGRLARRNIAVVERDIERLEHHNGHLRSVVFGDGTQVVVSALYARPSFEQHCPIPEALGCELNEQGYIHVDASQKTTADGVFACGDNTTSMRTLANAIGMGTAAGMMVNKELALEDFDASF